ncbi:hypothetical protein HJC23_012063 [Cyclotella cryptica]|uniref:Phosphoribosyltransferase domain-containing protein n=1 Tax=Cyclotella cryptica TaxID=29204 RepID=A0ABD3PSI5_9STRA|eukprot:CCRYP_011657-RA/>CCRYP_011657-RA protein AED:0.06 eAED:0.06 QI:284/1/1/1/1/1/3/605/786
MSSFVSRSLFPSMTLVAFLSFHTSNAFIASSSISTRQHGHRSSPFGVNIYNPREKPSAGQCSLSAKKRKNQEGENEDQWYESVDSNASPESVFWDEMERRRLLSTSYEDGMAAGERGVSPIDMVGKVGVDEAVSKSSRSSAVSGVASTIASQSNLSDDFFMGGGSSLNSSAMSTKNPGVTVAEERSAEATLAAYAAFAVSDNFLYNDEEEEEAALRAMGLRNDPKLWEGDDPTIEEENAELERQLDEWEKEIFGDGVDGSVVGGSSPFFDPALSDEPWDRYGQSRTSDDDESMSAFQKNLQRKMAMINKSHRELTLDYDDDHPEEAAAESAKEEEEYVKSLSSIGITSPRLENAAVNPKAEAFFKRAPDERQGYDTMWVSAIDQPCIQNLHGIFMNYGVQFADNFADWELGTEEDGFRSIEDIASFKARKVHQVTGLPCIASRTSFEVEPIRPEDMDKVNEEYAAAVAASGKKNVKPPSKSPRVITGYRFNDVGEHVDHIIQALMPFSEPTRVTRFRSCVCYYDGAMEIFEYGELDCDIYFSGSMRTFIPMSQALNSMLKTLQIALDLQYQKWLTSAVNDATKGGSISNVGIKLRDRVLKEAKVLPNDIIDVSSFMDAYVDVDLMDECGKDLADRFVGSKPNKILTIATTGLVIAIPMAKYLQVPLVYARKQRSVVMADTFEAGYNSKTIGKDRQLLVSKDHIDPEDRVLIVDDFLSSGASQEALLRIIAEAGATPVGVGVLLEKEYDAGRKSLSGFGVKVESIVKIASVRDGVIQLLEEDGYAKM